MRPPTDSVSVLRSQVVIPKECSVAELRTEIERVHRALFQSSGYVAFGIYTGKCKNQA